MKRRTFIGSLVLGIGTALALVYAPSVLAIEPISLDGKYKIHRQVVDGYSCEVRYRFINHNGAQIDWYRMFTVKSNKRKAPVLMFEASDGIHPSRVSFAPSGTKLRKDGWLSELQTNDPIEDFMAM